MSITRSHEIHRRRLGRNVGLALTLIVLIAVIFGLTVVKVSRGEYTPPKMEVSN